MPFTAVTIVTSVRWIPARTTFQLATNGLVPDAHVQLELVAAPRIAPGVGSSAHPAVVLNSAIAKLDAANGIATRAATDPRKIPCVHLDVLQTSAPPSSGAGDCGLSTRRFPKL